VLKIYLWELFNYNTENNYSCMHRIKITDIQKGKKIIPFYIAEVPRAIRYINGIIVEVPECDVFHMKEG
jgi:hypothetical protein